MRKPSMTAEQAESELGPRGNTPIRGEQRSLARKWLSAHGVPSLFAAGLSLKEMDLAYNQLNGEGLAHILSKLAKYRTEGGTEEETEEREESTMTAASTNGQATNGHDSGESNALIKLMREVLGRGMGCDESMVGAIVAKHIEELKTSLPTLRIEIKRSDATIHTIEGYTHPQFAKLLAAAKARNFDGYVPGIFIAGEASSGKTYGTKQLAEALGLTWHFNGAISMSHEMLGFMDGHGVYHRTAFREAYEFGGVYTFDEVDRSDPNALLAVNPHLANGVATFPDGQIKRHKDCIICCTANTWGLGASAEYSGATKLDAAFLSRFPRRIEWNIDEVMERALAGNDQWAMRVQRARSKARSAGIKIMIDTRMTFAGASLIADGMSEDDAARMTYLTNLKDEQRRMIEA